MEMKMPVDSTIITYPQKLLSLAQRLIGEGEFSIAVVVAHMACEVATERSLTEAFVKAGLPHLEDAVSEFLNGYNLGTPRIRKLYTALTRDEVQNAPFWEEFKNSADRRNMVVHSTYTVTQAEAEASYKATKDLVAHLKR
jgi:hypothetical protein